MRKIITLLIIISSSFLILTAQNTTVTVPNSQIKKITSNIVAGQEYELQISLPSGYESSNKSYPVVYLMDSQWDFPLVSCIYGEQYFDGFIPELIIVGVTWGGVNPNPDFLRARDYTPTNESRLVQSGGADKFLDFMNNELFPYIEQNYKVDKQNRTLMGCSLGGLFTMYTMLTHSEMFSGYVAATPAIAWDNEVLYQYEKMFAPKVLKTPIRTFMTVGEVEKSKSIFNKFSNFIIEKKYPNVSIQSKVLENTGHSGTKAETYSRGLQYIFEKKQLKLKDDVLNKYVGVYQNKTGDKLIIKKKNHQLICCFTEQNEIVLLANSENHFYTNQEFFNIYFNENNIVVDQLELIRYGSESKFKKIIN